MTRNYEGQTHCTVGALEQALIEQDGDLTTDNVEVLKTARLLLSMKVGRGIEEWNDRQAKGYDEVRDLLMHTAKDLRNGEI